MPARPSRSTVARATAVLLAAAALIVAALSSLLTQGGATSRAPTAAGLLGSASRDSGTSALGLRRPDSSVVDRALTGTVRVSVPQSQPDTFLLGVLAGGLLAFVMVGRALTSAARSCQHSGGISSARCDRGPPARAVCLA